MCKCCILVRITGLSEENVSHYRIFSSNYLLNNGQSCSTGESKEKEHVYLSIPWELIMGFFPESRVLWVSTVRIISFQFSEKILRHLQALLQRDFFEAISLH